MVAPWAVLPAPFTTVTFSPCSIPPLFPSLHPSASLHLCFAGWLMQTLIRPQSTAMFCVQCLVWKKTCTENLSLRWDIHMEHDLWYFQSSAKSQEMAQYAPCYWWYTAIHEPVESHVYDRKCIYLLLFWRYQIDRCNLNVLIANYGHSHKNI